MSDNIKELFNIQNNEWKPYCLTGSSEEDADFYEKYIPVPIIVNEKNHVIDGQHRLASAEYADPLHRHRWIN